MAVNQEARAFKAWKILASLAPKGKTITYENLAKALDIHHRAIRFVLERIQDYCLRKELPPLTILVVNKHTNEPGAGFIARDHSELDEGLSDVTNWDWARESNPYAFANDGTTENDVINSILASPESSKDYYSLIKVRGMQQVYFRKILLKAYKGHCALTGASFREALDAAHIIPWSQCKSDLRMNPINGILMLSCHHRLFDLGIISVDEDYKIIFRKPTKFNLTPSDKIFFANLHGKIITLPSNKALWPDINLIRERNIQLKIK
jgi:putative restriction endonuclease